ncbi:hypothetical protein [Streptomyces sp. XH2]
MRRWDRIVGSWAVGDYQVLDFAWDETIVDLGSRQAAYEYCANVDFAA